MSLTRAACKLVCRVMVGVLLFARLAVAGYACPGLASSHPMTAGSQDVMAVATEAVSPKVPDMASQSQSLGSGCEHIDEQAANLCVEHCHDGHQSADTPPAPAVLPADLAALYSVVAIEPEFLGYSRALAPPEMRPAAVSPPHAILHCVFRV